MVQGLVVLVNPSANVSDPWKTTLILYTIIILAVGFNIFCSQHLPLAEGESRHFRRTFPFYHWNEIDDLRRAPLRPCLRILRFPPDVLDHGGPCTSIKGLYGVPVSISNADRDGRLTPCSDGGAWGNIGLSCLIGLSTPVWCFIGPDAGAHMSEELRDASLQLPRAMMWATVLNGFLGITMLITFWYGRSLQRLSSQH